MSQQPEDVVFEFFKRIESTDYAKTRAAFDDMLADDAVWANTGLPTAEGKQACLDFLDSFHTFKVEGIRIEVLAWGSRGGAVVTERVDHLLGTDGAPPASLPVAGTFEVTDGRISAWRDYFDPRPFL